MSIAISSAIMAITTNSSINVKPSLSRMMFALPFQRDMAQFVGMPTNHDHNILSEPIQIAISENMPYDTLPVEIVDSTSAKHL